MRVVNNFNNHWFFTKEKELPTKISEEYEEVTLPHTWNALDGQDGGNDYHRGTCHYLKKFTKDELPVNDEYYLEIEGANASADVFLNGKKLAHHDGGYSTFRVNLTEALEEENLLIIAVDNSANDIVYPQMADFTFYGGLYRDVNLIAVNKNHFELDYYGGPGIKVTPILKEDNKALIEVEVYGNFEEEVTYKLFDKEGNELLSKVDEEKKIVFELDNPHLWNGRKDPYLYTVKANISEDEVSTRIGIRTFEIDADRGFILNGEEYPLRGVSRHQDYKGIGNALLKEHHKKDMELIYEVGANTIRLAHYQHNQYFYDLCDEYGMVVWAEIPYISKHMASANDNTKSQMKELVIQNYNHPSIVVWGLSNEITISTEVDDNLLNNHNGRFNRRADAEKFVDELKKTNRTIVNVFLDVVNEDGKNLYKRILGSTPDLKILNFYKLDKLEDEKHVYGREVEDPTGNVIANLSRIQNNLIEGNDLSDLEGFSFDSKINVKIGYIKKLWINEYNMFFTIKLKE